MAEPTTTTFTLTQRDVEVGHGTRTVADGQPDLAQVFVDGDPDATTQMAWVDLVARCQALGFTIVE
jgi:hypothetical protein